MSKNDATRSPRSLLERRLKTHFWRVFGFLFVTFIVVVPLGLPVLMLVNQEQGTYLLDNTEIARNWLLGISPMLVIASFYVVTAMVLVVQSTHEVLMAVVSPTRRWLPWVVTFVSMISQTWLLVAIGVYLWAKGKV